jgi:hypothetical protein
MLEMNFLGTPAVRESVQDNFDDFHVRIVNPRDSRLIKVNVCRWSL